MTTSKPTNQSELQLYRVLEKANLLQYYDTFIAQGGDDVQQLCEAGEEEFLEIMALVGMASKPLHVRRLQKALQEWVTNPGAFQQQSASHLRPGVGSIMAAVQRAVAYSPGGIHINSHPTPTQHSSPVVAWQTGAANQSLSPTPSTQSSHAGNDSPPSLSDHRDGDRRSTNSPLPIPVLVPNQIQAIAETAERLAKTLPELEPKPLNLKKPINKDIEDILKMPLDDPSRLELNRKYGAIYGRFDSKRKNTDKPMSMHEISVNEAAAQLCYHIPALLTRREELFPLARQVVRDSGYQYSKGHSRAASAETPVKKMKPDKDQSFQRQTEANPRTVQAELDKIKREERMTAINQELANITDQQDAIKSKIQDAKAEENFTLIHSLQAELEGLTTNQLQLLTEQSEIIRKQKRSEKYLKQKARESRELGFGEDVASDSNSPHVGAGNGDGGFYGIPASRKSVQARQLVHETLFDEGLRIAQQYGLGDFAEELIDLKHEDGNEDEEGNDDEVDEQEEWNREVEKDAIKQKAQNGKKETPEKTLSNGSASDKMDDKEEETQDGDAEEVLEKEKVESVG